jgi:glutamate synthase (NADPH/NADH) small chain
MRPRKDKRCSMGKTTGFIEFQRKTPGYRPKGERIGDFKAVELQLDEKDIYEQAARCMDCGIPFCHGCGCSLANIIPEFNDLVYQKRWSEALDILMSTNNFPEFTGRICPATCEAACVAGINGEPVTIRQIELEVIEKGFEKGYIQPSKPTTYRDERIAIIGSGPAGLAAADCLNKAGYIVTVFDSAKYPGGILRYGIPDFKLEKWVVERRIKLMEDEGIVFETGIKAGEDISYRYLKDRFDAVCLACGAREPRDLLIPGRELSGVYFAMDFLTQQNKRNSGETFDTRQEITASGKTVVVIGGGDTGSDCLGTSHRQGAKQVSQFEILPEPSIERPESTPWPTWPLILRETHAHKEGGTRKWAVTTKSFIGENEILKKMLCAEVKWEAKKEGEPLSPVEIPGTEFEVAADMVILAMGFTGPEKNRLVDELNIERDERGNVKTDQNHMTNVKGVFAAGDMVSGQSLVVRAIADGRDAATGIMEYLS